MRAPGCACSLIPRPLGPADWGPGAGCGRPGRGGSVGGARGPRRTTPQERGWRPTEVRALLGAVERWRRTDLGGLAGGLEPMRGCGQRRRRRTALGGYGNVSLRLWACWTGTVTSMLVRRRCACCCYAKASGAIVAPLTVPCFLFSALRMSVCGAALATAPPPPRAAVLYPLSHGAAPR